MNERKNDPLPEFNRQKCKRCGKVFIPGAEHIYKSKKYKSRSIYYCSWTCYLHSEDKELKLK